MNDGNFEQVIRTRRTTRKYLPRQVDEKTLGELVELATLAPSAMNLQPWRFSVVTSREALQAVNEEVKRTGLAMIQQAPELERFRAAFENPDYDIFYAAPALVVIKAPQGNDMAKMDCLLAAENVILAAHAMGLGTCFIGFVLLAGQSPQACRALAVEDGYEIVAPIIVGHTDSIPDTPPQRQPAQINWVR